MGEVNRNFTITTKTETTMCGVFYGMLYMCRYLSMRYIKHIACSKSVVKWGDLAAVLWLEVKAS